MKTGSFDENAIRARFDLIEIDGEGILINREDGGLYRLNRTAYEIWAALMDGRSIPTIADGLTQRFGIERGRAERDTLAALDQLPAPRSPPPTDRFRWSAKDSGYGFFVDELLLFEIDAPANSLRLGSGVTLSAEDARLHLKAVVPKILALRGIRALHAAAVQMAGSLLVFSGRSGAGKTTSARAFAAEGAQLVSEDLLVLASDTNIPDAMIGGEAVIRTWAAREGSRLATHPDQFVDCTALDRSLDGERRSVQRILLVDAERRTGDRIGIEELTRPEALIALMESTYFASADANSWRSIFGSLRGLVTGASTARATMPLGLSELRSAARTATYSEMIAS
jgi:hypothetical protein